MLVLSRKIGETLYLGDNIVIEVRRVAGSRVTLAIDAPREVRILRGELMEAATDFDDPVGEAASPSAASQLPASTPALPPNGAPPHDPAVEAVQVEPYLIAHPPVNPPGIVPGW